MTASVSDLQLEAWHEVQAAKRANNERDDMETRERLRIARKRMDAALRPSHDCE